VIPVYEVRNSISGPWRHGRAPAASSSRPTSLAIPMYGAWPFRLRKAYTNQRIRIGAGDGDRTRDIQLGKLAFYR
jgi:hypothetical protein